jgi:hypothetical protein
MLKSTPTKPADPPTRWHLTFVKSETRFFYTLSTQLNMPKKTQKIFENQGLEPLG